MTIKPVTEVLSVELNKDVHASDCIYRLKRGTTLRFVPGPSLLGKCVVLYSNYPKENEEFNREKYNSLTWHSKDGKAIVTGIEKFVEITNTDNYCEINTNLAGTFYFYFTFEDAPEIKSQGSLYIQIEPLIIVGLPGNQKNIPLDAVRCQTVLSKLLGPLTTWESKLRVAKESGYNVIHFSPIQELGGSRSGYSLKNQLKTNPDFGKDVTYEDVHKIIIKCRQEWGIASICDIVLNHTANESEWIHEHPEGTYSCATAPHLRPAFLLDAFLASVGKDVHAGFLEQVGVPPVIETEDHLRALEYQLHTNYLHKLNLYELYQCDIERYIERFIEEIYKRPTPSKSNDNQDRTNEIVLIQDPEYKRLQTKIDFELALQIFNIFRSDCFDEDARRKRCIECFRNRLEYLNNRVRDEIVNHLNDGIRNCIAGIRYERVQSDGPNVKEISKKYPLFQTYFTHGKLSDLTINEVEQKMYGDEGKYCMAHNGWVMNGDPLKDFAKPQEGTGNVYVRRELIAWGDSVKLRYGDKPSDSPYLWEHMKQYVNTIAKIFDGVRLDNCHSTPLHVAEYLLDHARIINPELYVVAELFTNSDGTDNIFVNRLGITSLIREALSAWDSHEQGRLVYRYGGASVGAFYSSPKRILAPGIAHALFLDLTHDNPSPIQKRSVFDSLPSAALVSMACCATGSTRGYDELVPIQINVVDEERQYQEWNKHVFSDIGIIAAKRALNLLHGEMAEQGFSQVYVDQMDPNIVAITRHSPTTHQSIILVAHTSFSFPGFNCPPTRVGPLRFEGVLDEIILEADTFYVPDHTYKACDDYINGVLDYTSRINEHIPLSESEIFRTEANTYGHITELEFENLKPGSVVVVRVSLHEEVRPRIASLQKYVNIFHNEEQAEDLKAIVSKMNLLDINRALYMCDEEEKECGRGGTYDIPNFGHLVYCGLQGFSSVLAQIAPHNDLGHPFCGSLRDGNWMIDYVSQRLNEPGTAELGEWFKNIFNHMKEIPRYLIPSYFDVIIMGVQMELKKHCIELMSEFIQHGSGFTHSLALGSVQVVSLCLNADLPKMSPNMKPPKPTGRCATLSAGLPHFSTGYMRCWGRDTFIAMRGLLLLSGRHNEARLMILGFGSTLRHGLIPNLLDSGSNPRFNCRDAIWWWLHCVKQYVTEVPNGKDILTDKVSRMYPNDESMAKNPGEHDQFLYEVIQEALQVHFQGLMYRERNAGQQIDAHMKDPGFNNQIGVHPETGFVFGGNEFNCGTWMDKMGSSEKSGNRGYPSTPRDGSAIEIVGLQMASLRFMQSMAEQKIIPCNSVERKCNDGNKFTWTYKEWADRIAQNFEKHYFVETKGPNVNKTDIYKDTLGSRQHWTDYQLRCNFPIAMAVAPEMFNSEHAWKALDQAQKYLLGPLGMKTLDPEDWAYRGDYDNSNDSDDPTVAHGANYHQGPEWVWPIGFYLRARLIFGRLTNRTKQAKAEIWSVLSRHLREVKTSPWRGLPELTNSNGSYCKHSCPTQAWSMATVIEVLYDLNQIPK